jgi:hypothetical protein
MTAGELVVGIGTLALAGFTAWLARRTSAEVEISEAQMRLARSAIEAQDQPFVIPASRTPRGVLIGSSFIAKLENLGKGPAMVHSVQIRSSSTNHPYLDDPFEGQVRAIAPGQSLGIALPLMEGAPSKGTHLTVQISYSAASGVGYTTYSSGLVLDLERLAFSGHQRHSADGREREVPI